MPSVYNYRHVELDKVGRGKRAIQPPGGPASDIFGRYEQNFSSASSQAGSDVASSRVHIETDQQSIGSSSSGQPLAMPLDGMIKQQQIQQQQQQQQQQHQQRQQVGAAGSDGQISPTGSISSSSLASSSGTNASGVQQPHQQMLLTNSAYKPSLEVHELAASCIQQHQASLIDARTPKKTIPVLRRNPITGEILGSSSGQPSVVRVRQPPGGRSSGIF